MLEKHHRHCGLGKKETDDANGPCYSNHNVFNSDDFGYDAIVDNDWLVVSGINPDFKEEYSLQQATPADEGAPPKQDLLYQAALAAAAQKAAAAGKFDRNTSPKLLAKLTTDSSESLQTSNINDTLNEYDPNTYDADFDDNVIAEANDSALANDSDGFYVREFVLLCLE
ncbi:hypothetical protein QBC37DRAFT_459484 [Rhypophila decipiens]|uniref:Uncharacterized protein n=1 Tax=Rhypophila decipiens TaxID=261697 RepID=A0AAN6XTL9_9PEZI|nr:hypothetical protein QBC37DRAFT_459484 [Rhypophila decipiens]